MYIKNQLENENKRPFKNCTEKSIKIRIQLENVNENSIRKFQWKFNLKVEIKVYLEIGKKVYENNENWEITKIKEFQLENGIEESQKMKKKSGL